MILAAIVGLLTAWYLGVRAGVIAAVVSFLAILAGGFIPGMMLPAYGLVAVWCAAMYFLGPQISKSSGRKNGLRDNPAVNAAGQVGSAVNWAKRAVERVLK
jgi:hypothetical protein